jgi:hypothetical protein
MLEEEKRSNPPSLKSYPIANRIVTTQPSLPRQRRLEFSRGLQSTAGVVVSPVASATIEFSRRSRDARIFFDHPVG